MGFTLWFLFFFLVVRFVLPRVLRAVLGSFVRQQVHKAQQGGYQQPGGQQQQTGQYQQAANGRPTPPGQVRVDYVPPKAQPAQKNEFRGGEYVEYEEV